MSDFPEKDSLVANGFQMRVRDMAGGAGPVGCLGLGLSKESPFPNRKLESQIFYFSGLRLYWARIATRDLERDRHVSVDAWKA